MLPVMTSTTTSSNLNQAEAAGGRYRPDIDGLRAVAVLPVVFYHYGIAPFSGGFVGVDVFFVISGYLITQLIWTEMGERRFTFLNFYERRIRRIFPALFAVMAASFVAALFILFPKDFDDYARSLVATAAFVSNFHFWGEVGYWDAAATQKPLLHTWSLAVEEQFYLLFPAILLYLRPRGKALALWVLGGLLVASLGFAVVGAYRWPATTFYLLPMRFWELLIGCVLAVGKFRTPENPLLRNAISAIGFALIAWAVFALTDDSAFPGANAIPPCLGAALIVYAGSGGKTLVNRALSMRLPVIVGLISYSLYLWHWPIYVYALQIQPNGLTTLQTWLAIAASVALAALSWRYVEQPFRRSASHLSSRTLFRLAGAGAAMAIALGAAGWTMGGLPQRYSPAIQRILAEANDWEPRRSTCFNRSPSRIVRGDACLIGAKGAKPDFLLWGDSHADALLPAVSDAAASKGRAGYVAAHGHCAAALGVSWSKAKECVAFNAAVAKIAMRPEIKTVVLDARWAPDAGEPGVRKGATDIAELTDSQSTMSSPAETRAAFIRGMTRTVRMLAAAHKQIIIVGGTPEFPMPVPTELAKMALYGKQWPLVPTRAEYLARQEPVYAIFENLQRRYKLTIVHPEDVFCPGTICVAMLDGRPLFRDYSHMSVFGARHLTPLFKPLF